MSTNFQTFKHFRGSTDESLEDTIPQNPRNIKKC